MKNLHLLFFCFLSAGALCSIPIFTKTEGEDLSFGCFFNSPQSPKFFIKREREKKKVILETSGVRAEKGKYSINYDTIINVFYVSITQLDKSDSGQYSCGLGTAYSPDSLREFEVRVTDAMCDGNTTLVNPVISVCTEAEGESIRVRCSFPSAAFFNLFFCKDACKKQDVLIETSEIKAQRGRFRIDYEKNGVFYVSVANLSKSDSGMYSCGVDRTSAPNPCQTVKINVTDANQYTVRSSLSGPGSCTLVSAFPAITTLPAGTAPNTSPPFSETLEQQSENTGYVLPLVLCLAVFAVLVALLLFLYKKMKRESSGLNVAESSNSENIECSTY